MRWKENFAAILRDQGLNLSYSVVPDDQGHYDTEIMVEFNKDGKLTKKDIKKYLAEEVNSSLHEIIRGNVFLATRYFNPIGPGGGCVTPPQSTYFLIRTFIQNKIIWKLNDFS